MVITSSLLFLADSARTTTEAFTAVGSACDTIAAQSFPKLAAAGVAAAPLLDNAAIMRVVPLANVLKETYSPSRRGPLAGGVAPDYSALRRKYASAVPAGLLSAMFDLDVFAKSYRQYVKSTGTYMGTFLITSNKGSDGQLGTLASCSTELKGTKATLNNLVYNARRDAVARVPSDDRAYDPSFVRNACPFVTEYDIAVHGSVLANAWDAYARCTTLEDVIRLDASILQVQMFGGGDELTDYLLSNIALINAVAASGSYKSDGKSVERFEADLKKASSFDEQVEVMLAFAVARVNGFGDAGVHLSGLCVSYVPLSNWIYTRYMLGQSFVALAGSSFVIMSPYHASQPQYYNVIFHELSHCIFMSWKRSGQDPECAGMKPGPQWHTTSWYRIKAWILAKATALLARGQIDAAVTHVPSNALLDDGYKCNPGSFDAAAMLPTA